MKAYSNKRKHTLEDGRHSGIPGTSKHYTKGFKEEVRNANRAGKKTARQQSKSELRNYKNDLDTTI